MQEWMFGRWYECDSEAWKRAKKTQAYWRDRALAEARPKKHRDFTLREIERMSNLAAAAVASPHSSPRVAHAIGSHGKSIRLFFSEPIITDKDCLDALAAKIGALRVSAAGATLTIEF